jgi:hypothetical protein
VLLDLMPGERLPGLFVGHARQHRVKFRQP